MLLQENQANKAESLGLPTTEEDVKEGLKKVVSEPFWKNIDYALEFALTKLTLPRLDPKLKKSVPSFYQPDAPMTDK